MISKNKAPAHGDMDPPGHFFVPRFKICRKGWLEDGQSPKGLVEGGVEKWRGSRAEGGGGEGKVNLPPNAV